jgi:alpha-mannosidase
MLRCARVAGVVALGMGAVLGGAAAARAQTMKAGDITKQPTLYVVPYAHLDTQWRWDFQQVISEYLLKTMRVNFDYIQKYPKYVFNWTGSNRYRLMKEYYPDDYARVKGYVATGNWYPAGSSVEEGDVNLPSAESIFRQVLYGNEYFRKEFGKASAEYMLPDCFGFPASLPTILAHSGVLGFSTQKLNSNWQPAPVVGGPGSVEETPEGIPFNVGLWVGPDGSTVMAALNPGSYSEGIRSDLSQPLPPGRGPIKGEATMDWPPRIELDGKVTGVFADYHYVGTGDIGGAADEESIKLLEATVDKTDAVLPVPAGGTPGPAVRLGMGPVNVISSAADQMFLDIKPDMQTKLPRYTGDLELINHSAGSLTSETFHKRMNRENEILAGAAEEASVAAMWMGQTYPEQRMTDAWTLLLGGQFHDTGAGTADPRAYEFAQNDDMIVANQFAGMLTSATQAVASEMNTEGPGVPVVVDNPLNIEREDVVEPKVDFGGELPKEVRVVGPDGRAVPGQMEDGKVLFLARTPSVGYAVFHVQPGRAASLPRSGELKVSETGIENARYRVKIDAGGDVTSIFDKSLNKELLAAPMRLAISNDAPKFWPAWNMDFDQEQAAPRAYVSGRAKIRVVEDGPVRVAVEVARETEGSKFVQTVSLAAGDAGNRVVFHEAIDWRGKSSNVKAVFPLTASNKMATYNWEVGTVQRPTAMERQFEVASHHWIDLMDSSGTYGATILTDVKNGSDKPDDHTIRLTLIRTPGLPAGVAHPQGLSYSDQLNQDWGHHDIVFGIAGHAGDWRTAQTDWQAYRLSTPLVAFASKAHAGSLGREFSLLTVSDSRVRVLALKKAEASDEVVVRLVEMDGKPANDVRVKFAGPVTAAREVNGQEQPVGPGGGVLDAGNAKVVDGALQASFGAYEPRTFALTLGAAPAKVQAVKSQTVALKYDLAASSNDDTKSVGGFDPAGDALPAEMLPSTLMYSGVNFELGPAGTGKQDAVVARGQTIDLPEGHFNKVWVLAAAYDGDQKAVFRAGDKAVPVTVEDWGGFIGQWDTRVWKAAPDDIRKDWAVSANHATWDLHDTGSAQWSPNYPEDYVGLRPGFVKRADLAWYCSHHHTAAGLNEPYEYSYLFAYPIDLPAGTRKLTLPVNDKVRVMAVSVAEEQPGVKPAQPLYDTLESAEPTVQLEPMPMR